MLHKVLRIDLSLSEKGDGRKRGAHLPTWGIRDARMKVKQRSFF